MKQSPPFLTLQHCADELQVAFAGWTAAGFLTVFGSARGFEVNSQL